MYYAQHKAQHTTLHIMIRVTDIKKPVIKKIVQHVNIMYASMTSQKNVPIRLDASLRHWASDVIMFHGNKKVYIIVENIESNIIEGDKFFGNHEERTYFFPIKELKHCLHFAKETTCDKVILFSNKLSIQCSMLVSGFDDNKHFQHIDISNMYCDVKAHCLQPLNVRLLKAHEKEKLRKDLKRLTKLPWIQASDPLIIYVGATKKDVVEVRNQNYSVDYFFVV